MERMIPERTAGRDWNRGTGGSDRVEAGKGEVDGTMGGQYRGLENWHPSLSVCMAADTVEAVFGTAKLAQCTVLFLVIDRVGIGRIAH